MSNKENLKKEENTRFIYSWQDRQKTQTPIKD